MPTFNIPSRAADIYDIERANAALMLGRNDLVTWFSPVGLIGPSNGFATILGGTGDWGWVSGGVQLFTGATSASSALFSSTAKGSALSQTIRSGADWYISARFKVATTPTTGTIISVGTSDFSSNRLKIGVDVASVAANFCMSGPSGAAINSGIAFDTNIHNFRGWHTGSSSSLQIDGGAVTSGTANISADAAPALLAVNGTAANQAGNFEWAFFAVPPL